MKRKEEVIMGLFDRFMKSEKLDIQVKAGQLLLEFDREEIKRAGHPVTTAFVLTNSADYPELYIDTGKEYQTGEKTGHI